MELEEALARLFTHKQKELIKKRSRGETLTKTEREYYSRRLKKKILALTNQDLQRIARVLMR